MVILLFCYVWAEKMLSLRKGLFCLLKYSHTNSLMLCLLSLLSFLTVLKLSGKQLNQEETCLIFKAYQWIMSIMWSSRSSAQFWLLPLWRYTAGQKTETVAPLWTPWNSASQFSRKSLIVSPDCMWILLLDLKNGVEVWSGIFFVDKNWQ